MMRTLTQSQATQFAPALPLSINMRRSYDRYYATGLYETRYPVPNPHMLALLLGELGPEGGRVLDFGCGSGRYALALAERKDLEVFAYDISAAAIHDLNRRYDEMVAADAACGSLQMFCGGFDELERRLDGAPGGDSGFDVVALLFGVLGHIAKRERRVATLRSLRARLRPGGRVIATVPNRARRFLPEQQACAELVAEGVLEPGDIHYQRHNNGEPIDLYYHLYSPAEFRAELREAGFAIDSLRPESVLSERMVLSSPVAAACDRVLCRATPISLAYGMVAVARPLATAAG